MHCYFWVSGLGIRQADRVNLEHDAGLEEQIEKNLTMHDGYWNIDIALIKEHPYALFQKS